MALGVIADASPVVQLRATIEGGAHPIPLLGLDMFRTLTVSPSLVIRPQIAHGRRNAVDDPRRVLDQDALYLSRDAMTQTGFGFGDRVECVRMAGRTTSSLRGTCRAWRQGRAPRSSTSRRRNGASDALGTLDRVDLKLKPGTVLADAKAQLASVLPASAAQRWPRPRAGAATRSRAPIASTSTCSHWSRC